MEESTKMIMYPEFSMCKVIDTYLDPIYVFYKTFLVNVFGFFCVVFTYYTLFLCHNAPSLDPPGIAMLKMLSVPRFPNCALRCPPVLPQTLQGRTRCVTFSGRAQHRLQDAT